MRIMRTDEGTGDADGDIKPCTGELLRDLEAFTNARRSRRWTSDSVKLSWRPLAS